MTPVFDRPCVKCGAFLWAGPRYTQAILLGIREWLAFTCGICGYQVRVPCLDSPDYTPRKGASI